MNQSRTEEKPLKSLRSYLKAPKVRDFGDLTIGNYNNQKELDHVEFDSGNRKVRVPKTA